METASKSYNNDPEDDDIFRTACRVSVKIESISQFSSVSGLDENPLISAPVYTQNAAWVLEVSSHKAEKDDTDDDNDGETYLYAVLKCNDDYPADFLWSCSAKGLFYLDNQVLFPEDRCERFFQLFSSEKSLIVFRTFIPWSKLKDDVGCVMDDCVTFIVDIEAATPFCDQQLNNDFAFLYAERPFADVTIKIGDADFDAHKVVLMARSGYFHGLFMSGMSEPLAGTVELPDVECDVFDLMLRFIYCGVVDLSDENLQTQLELLCLADRLLVDSYLDYYTFKEPPLDAGNLMEALLVSYQIQYRPLKVHCMRKFKKILLSSTDEFSEMVDKDDFEMLKDVPVITHEMFDILEDTVDKVETGKLMAALVLAHRYGCEELKETCLDSFKKKKDPRKILATPSFKKLDKNSELHRDLLIAMLESSRFDEANNNA